MKELLSKFFESLSKHNKQNGIFSVLLLEGEEEDSKAKEGEESGDRKKESGVHSSFLLFDEEEEGESEKEKLRLSQVSMAKRSEENLVKEVGMHCVAPSFSKKIERLQKGEEGGKEETNILSQTLMQQNKKKRKKEEEERKEETKRKKGKSKEEERRTEKENFFLPYLGSTESNELQKRGEKNEGESKKAFSLISSLICPSSPMHDQHVHEEFEESIEIDLTSFEEKYRKALEQKRKAEEKRKKEEKSKSRKKNSKEKEEMRTTFGEGRAGGEGVSEKEFKKEHFCELEFVGQFNKGFIIGSLFKEDLFIIDQHASHEKYNFEKLLNSLQISSQKLLSPLPLSLNPSLFSLLLSHLPLLSSFGWNFHFPSSSVPPSDQPNATTATTLSFLLIDEEEKEEERESSQRKEGSSQHRVELLSLPSLPPLTFSKEDLFQFLEEIREKEENVVSEEKKFSGEKTKEGLKIVPSKVRDAMASKSCRMSVMVGKSLSESFILSLLQNLSLLHSPWNCPHGRPTLRHLFTLPPSFSSPPLPFFL